VRAKKNAYVDSRWGYAWVRKPANFPDYVKFKRAFIRKHHLIYWLHTGKTVPAGYVLHHRNHNKLDNRFRNLQLMTHAEHASHHTRGRRVKFRPDYTGYEVTDVERKRRSERAKAQHRMGKLGSTTWINHKGRSAAQAKLMEKQ
jgi:hypothetical protein